jgi:hypothetical protein
MRRTVTWVCAMAVVLGTLSIRAMAQADTTAPREAPQTFRLELDGSEQKQPSWIILVQSDGTGLYWPTLTAKFGQIPVRLSEATWKRVHGGAAAIEGNRCETKQKNIAKTGMKDVDYQGGATGSPDATCTFNYSDDAGLNDAVAALESMVSTMQFGDRLQHELRYDRLGLDAEIDSLAEEVKNGSAIEAQNIAPVLQSLIDDDRVMERVKRKAAHLLEGAGIAVKNYTPEPSAR